MTGLAASLDTLVQDNGKPDVLRRYQELEKLLDGLQQNEIRFLQERLRKYAFGLDILPNLPVEIQVMVMDYLDFLDLTMIRCVSRTWRGILNKKAICMFLMKKHFRSVYEKSIASGENIGKLPDTSEYASFNLPKLPGEQLQGEFRRAAESLQAIHSGRYSLATRRYYENPNLNHGLAVKAKSQRYSHGRIACEGNGKINLIHLGSGALTSYFLPHREEIGLWELSEMYLVATAAHSTMMYVWQIQGGLFNVRLPAQPSVISVDSEKIGITTVGGEVFIWSPISKLRQFPLAPLRLPVYDKAILFHTRHATTSYVISLVDSGPLLIVKSAGRHSTVKTYEVGQITVQKYVKNELTTTKCSEICLDDLDSLQAAQPDDMLRSIPLYLRRVDDNGTYIVAYFKINSGATDGHWCSCRPDNVIHGAYEGSEGSTVVYITFNIFTETLCSRTFHDVPCRTEHDLPTKNEYHMWADHLYNPTACFKNIRHKPERARLRNMLVAIHPCTGSGPTDPHESQKSPRVRPRCIIGDDLGNQRISELDEESKWRDVKLAYIWIGDLRPPAEAGRLQGDVFDKLKVAKFRFNKSDWVQKTINEDDEQVVINAVQDTETKDDIAANTSLQKPMDPYIGTGGDGKFVVAFGEWSYMVWTFDPSIKFATTDCTLALP